MQFRNARPCQQKREWQGLERTGDPKPYLKGKLPFGSSHQGLV